MGRLESGTYVQVIETGRIGEVLSRELNQLICWMFLSILFRTGNEEETRRGDTKFPLEFAERNPRCDYRLVSFDEKILQ